METTKIEYKESYHEGEFCEVITGMLNGLNLSEKGELKIGFSQDGKIKGLKDLDDTYKQIETLVKKIDAAAMSPEHVMISPSPQPYLKLERKNDNGLKTITVQVEGNLKKPYFYKGCIHIKYRSDEKNRLRLQDEIISFIKKQEFYPLLNNPSFKKWRHILCKAFQTDDPQKFEVLLNNFVGANWLTEEDLKVLEEVYSIIKGVNWFDDEKLNDISKEGIHKILQAAKQVKRNYHSSQTFPTQFLFDLCNAKGDNPYSLLPFSDCGGGDFSQRKAICRLISFISGC